MFAYFFLRTAVQLFPQIQCLAFATMVSLRATLMNISYRLISISIIRIEYTDINSIHTYTSMYIYIYIYSAYMYIDMQSTYIKHLLKASESEPCKLQTQTTKAACST